METAQHSGQPRLPRSYTKSPCKNSTRTIYVAHIPHTYEVVHSCLAPLPLLNMCRNVTKYAHHQGATTIPIYRSDCSYTNLPLPPAPHAPTSGPGAAKTNPISRHQTTRPTWKARHGLHGKALGEAPPYCNRHALIMRGSPLNRVALFPLGAQSYSCYRPPHTMETKSQRAHHHQQNQLLTTTHSEMEGAVFFLQA